jgi:hypothetical protein
MRSGKPWTLHADQQTQAILADCPMRQVSEATAAEYRRAYDNLLASGRTPLDAASTRNHWDKLRTASRFCMEQDIRAWRAASERARKRGDIESAQRRTERAFQLAAVLDEMFMQTHRRTWAHKAAEMKAAGVKPMSRSKRATGAPPPDLATVALLAGNRRGTKVADRHAERLAVLALFGMRPAELKKGVRLALVEGGRFLTVQVVGAKVNDQRGQEARVIRVPVEGCAAIALAQVVEADEDVGVPAEAGKAALRLLRLDTDGRDGTRVTLRRVEIRHPSIAQRRGSSHRDRLAPGDDQRWTAGLARWRVDAHIRELMVAARVGDRITGPERA